MRLKLHIVKDGETLQAVSEKYNVAVEELRTANESLSLEEPLTKGTKLKIPVQSRPIRVTTAASKPKSQSEPIGQKQPAEQNQPAQQSQSAEEKIPDYSIASFYDMPKIPGMDELTPPQDYWGAPHNSAFSETKIPTSHKPPAQPKKPKSQFQLPAAPPAHGVFPPWGNYPGIGAIPAYPMPHYGAAQSSGWHGGSVPPHGAPVTHTTGYPFSAQNHSIQAPYHPYSVNPQVHPQVRYTVAAAPPVGGYRTHGPAGYPYFGVPAGSQRSGRVPTPAAAGHGGAREGEEEWQVPMQNGEDERLHQDASPSTAEEKRRAESSLTEGKRNKRKNKEKAKIHARKNRGSTKSRTKASNRRKRNQDSADARPFPAAIPVYYED